MLPPSRSQREREGKAGKRTAKRLSFISRGIFLTGLGARCIVWFLYRDNATCFAFFPSRPLIMISSLIPGCVQRPSGGWSLVVLNSRACGGTGEVEGEDEAGKEYASYSPALV